MDFKKISLPGGSVDETVEPVDVSEGSVDTESKLGFDFVKFNLTNDLLNESGFDDDEVVVDSGVVDEEFSEAFDGGEFVSTKVDELEGVDYVSGEVVVDSGVVVNPLLDGFEDDLFVSGFNSDDYVRPGFGSDDVDAFEAKRSFRESRGYDYGRARGVGSGVVDDSGPVDVVDSDDVHEKAVRVVNPRFNSMSEPSVVIVDEFGEVVSARDLKKSRSRVFKSDSVSRYGGLENDPLVKGVNLDDSGVAVERGARQPWESGVNGSRKISVRELERFSSIRNVDDGVVAGLKQVSDFVLGDEALKRGSRARVTLKDLEVLHFLAMFKYAKVSHVSNMFGIKEASALARLRRLRNRGLVVSKVLYGADSLWWLTEAGLVVSGCELPRVTEAGLTYSMFPHQFTVNHIASHLWGAGVNVLNLGEWPVRVKHDVFGERFGEVLVSELEIQSSFSRFRGFSKADVFLPELSERVDGEFADWEASGGVSAGVSPEFLPGNEYMWALRPPRVVGLNYHVPDLVVRRDRSSDGSPNSIAVEVELNRKNGEAYERTLRAYKMDDRFYGKVVWVCRSKALARRLLEVAMDIGLYQEGRFDVVPVLTSSGVFKGRDVWRL